MADYKTPGVYIEEIPKLPGSVVQVETAIPAFIGYTDKALRKGEDITFKPTRITSLLDYEKYFGRANPKNLVVELDGEDHVKTVSVEEGKTAFKMYYSLQFYFKNGGGPCYIVSVGDYSGGVDRGELSDGLATLEKEDEPTLLLFPDATELASDADFYGVYQEALDLSRKMRDRFTIIDTRLTAKETDDVEEIVEKLREGLKENLSYGAAYFPWIEANISYYTLDEDFKISGGTLDGKNLNDLKSDNTGAYNRIVAEIKSAGMILPPSSAMAGIYARVDNDRGVWKAPANVGVFDAIGPTLKVTDNMQENLNVDATSGKSINAIRSFTGKGTMVWGARTLAGNDNEWRYIPVRRLFIMMEESIKKATEFVVFEPNDANTWSMTKSMIENFLTNLWKQGALAGSKPEHAFYVSVGLGLTMTAQDILEGKLIIEVGVAAVRPAEFIILRFSHKLQQS